MPIPKRVAKLGVMGITVSKDINNKDKPKIALVSFGSVNSFKLGRSKSLCKNKMIISQ
jgi:fatty acid/phospholipid biosynthesis enzyme